jgi:hypothetical protein
MLVDEGRAMCPSVNALFQAVLLRGERTLEESDVVERYRRARDRALERQMTVAVQQLMGEEGTYRPNVFDSPDSHGEHDLVVWQGGDVVVFEAKASPPKEPFRDLERGFRRLQHAFRGDGGIQKAYEQTERLRSTWSNGDRLTLYNRDGEPVLDLAANDVKNVLGVCVTRDDWGPGVRLPLI